MKFMKYLAHTEDGKTVVKNEESCQILKEHLENTARNAKEKAAVFNAGEAAEIIGLLHDVGKYSIDFQRKLRREPAKKKSIGFWKKQKSLKFVQKQKIKMQIRRNARSVSPKTIIF